MLQWRSGGAGANKHAELALFFKKTYAQRYEKILMRWGSGLFWVYSIQCGLGVLLALQYCVAFDAGLPGTAFLWWETSGGSFLVRLHSEMGNLVFLFLYGHVFTKLWTSVDASDADGYATWVSGSIIFILTYAAGVTGAIMPWSILSEVTATIVGSAVNSLVYIKFDFMETLLIPGMALNEEAVWRNFVVHAAIPLVGLALGLMHMLRLHVHKYSAAGGFKRLAYGQHCRGARRWSYANRYWNRAFGTWLRCALALMGARLAADLAWPRSMAVAYAYSNFEYWPIAEDIDFVLAIPHWYLRPIMGALVVLPHHYLGFGYVALFFCIVLLMPWLYERSDDDMWQQCDAGDSEGWATPRWDALHCAAFLLFILAAAFACAVVPTGKYFISVGAMDMLTLAYWYLVIYVLVLSRLAFYVWRLYYGVHVRFGG